MKVCKKCKKHVANKSKICKYCGADVSTAKIIKNQNNKPNTPKKKVEKIPKKDIKKTEEIKEKEIVKDDTITMVEVPAILKPEEIKEEEPKKKKEIIKKTKEKINDIKEKRRKKKEDKPKKEKKVKDKKKKDIKPKKEKKVKSEKDNKKLKRQEKKQVKKEDKKKILDNTANILKDKTGKIKDINKDFGLKVKEKALEKTEILSEKTVLLIKNSKKAITNSSAVKSKKVKLIAKITTIIGLICLIVGVTLYITNGMTTQEITTIKGTPATNDKLFSVGDVIEYKGVNYKVANVKLSEGNGYSVPRDGDVFLIVTIYIMNNTNKKIDYGYTSWVMTDKDDNKARKIFSSINVDDALYSGKLAPGKTKRGSIIFEEALNAEKLRLSFYELEVNQDKEEVIDTDKKAFTVSIDMPKKEEKK